MGLWLWAGLLYIHGTLCQFNEWYFNWAYEIRCTIAQVLNDISYFPVTHNVMNQNLLHDTIDSLPPEVFFQAFDDIWDYQLDWPNWDVPNPPLVTLMEQRGDCDDYARLAAYVLHRKGYRAWYVAASTVTTGHAFVIFHNPKTQEVGLIDNNGTYKLQTGQYIANRNELILDVASIVYPSVTFLIIKTWNLIPLGSIRNPTPTSLYDDRVWQGQQR